MLGDSPCVLHEQPHSPAARSATGLGGGLGAAKVNRPRAAAAGAGLAAAGPVAPKVKAGLLGSEGRTTRGDQGHLVLGEHAASQSEVIRAILFTIGAEGEGGLARRLVRAVRPSLQQIWTVKYGLSSALTALITSDCGQVDCPQH